MVHSRRIALLLALAACGPVRGFAQETTAPPALDTVPAQEAADDSLEAIKVEADQAYRKGDYVQTIALTEQVLAKNPEDHVALYLRSSARVEQGYAQRDTRLIRQGIADAREAIRLEGQGKADYYLPYLYGMTNLAILEQKASHAETARSIADQVLKRTNYTDAERANLVYQRGLARIQTRTFDAARADFAEAIRLKSDHLAAHVALCNITNETRGPDEALAAFTRAVAGLPGNPLILNNRAMHLHSLGRNKEAMADFAAALKADPQYLPALINRSFVQMQTGNTDAAMDDLVAALAIDSNSTQALAMRGTLLTQLGRSQEAIADYQRVCDLQPTSGMAAADLGFAYFFSGKYNEALTEFNKALTLSPDIQFLTPWRYAAAIRIRKDLSTDPAVKAALARTPDQRTWFDWLTAFEAGQVTENQLIGAANPKDEIARKAQLCEAYYFIGLEMLRRKKPDDARASFLQAVETEAERLSAFRGARFALQEIEDDTAAK